MDLDVKNCRVGKMIETLASTNRSFRFNEEEEEEEELLNTYKTCYTCIAHELVNLC